MSKLITLIVFAVLYFFGYLYLIADPDDPLRKQIFTAVGLEKAAPEPVKAQSLEEIQSLADGMSAEERWEMRGKLFSYLTAVERGNTEELMTPPLNTETLLKNAPRCVKHLRVLRMKKEDAENILPILEDVRIDWGVSHCGQCSNTLIIECTACTKKEVKKTPAAAPRKTAPAVSASGKESELGANSVSKAGVVSGKEWMNRRMSAGKSISSMKMLGSRELDRSGSSKVKPIKGTSTTVSKADTAKTANTENDDSAEEETVQKGVRFCRRCQNTKEIVCPACRNRSEERVRHYSGILQAEIQKLLPLFPK